MRSLRILIALIFIGTAYSLECFVGNTFGQQFGIGFRHLRCTDGVRYCAKRIGISPRKLFIYFLVHR